MFRVLAFAIFSFALGFPALARTQCTPDQSSPVAVDPANPTSTQPFTISVGIYGWNVRSVSEEIQGNTIDVTLGGFDASGFDPPTVPCTTMVVGPLPPGSYTVNLKTKDLEAGTTASVASMSFVVGENSFVSCVPGPSGYLSVDAPNPTDTQVITLTVGREQAIAPESVVVRRVGNTMTATLTAKVNDFSVALPDFCPTIALGPLRAGTYAVNLDFVDSGALSPHAVPLRSTSFSASTSHPGPLTGLWWNSAEAGWGIDFVQHRDAVFSAWFTYDGAGRPTWYVAPNCALATAGSSQGCTGDLYQVKGPIVLGGAFNPSVVVATQVGTLTLGFADVNIGTMTYTVGGQTRTVPIAREPLRTGPAPAVDYNDLWWNPAESGWGVTITQQSSVMFLALYVFDGGGVPVWYVVPDCEVDAADTGCTGTIYRTMGPAFGPTFDASKVRAVSVGGASVTFTDPNNGTLRYSLDGAVTSKAITRQLF